MPAVGIVVQSACYIASLQTYTHTTIFGQGCNSSMVLELKDVQTSADKPLLAALAETEREALNKFDPEKS